MGKTRRNFKTRISEYFNSFQKGKTKQNYDNTSTATHEFKKEFKILYYAN